MEQQVLKTVRARASAMSAAAPSGHAPNLLGAPPAVPMNQAPVRIPDGSGVGGGPVMRSRSVFDESVRGVGAQVREVRLLAGLGPLLQSNAAQMPSRGAVPMMAGPRPPKRVQAVLSSSLGQEAAPTSSEVQKILQRETEPKGIAPDEAAALAAALTPALEASTKAIAESVVCGNVDSFVVQEVRVLRDGLVRFAANGARDERLDISAGDLSKIDAVLACQVTYDQVAEPGEPRRRP